MALLLRRGLEEEGYAVDLAPNATEGLHLGIECNYDVVVLDVMLPDGDGIDALRQLRSKSRWMPVLILTAKDAVDDRVRGLDAGADDYLVKPFALPELLARLRALVRRTPPPTRSVSASTRSHSAPRSSHSSSSSCAIPARS